MKRCRFCCAGLCYALVRLPYENIAVQSVEGMPLAARAHAERRGTVHVHEVSPAVASHLRRVAERLDVEIREDVALHRVESELRRQAGRERHVELAVDRP